MWALYQTNNIPTAAISCSPWLSDSALVVFINALFYNRKTCPCIIGSTTSNIIGLMNTVIQTSMKYNKKYQCPFCTSSWTLTKNLTPQDLVLFWLCITEGTKVHTYPKLSWRKQWPWWNAVAATAVFQHTLDNKTIHHGKVYISYAFLWNFFSASWRDSTCLLNTLSSQRINLFTALWFFSIHQKEV